MTHTQLINETYQKLLNGTTKMEEGINPFPAPSTRTEALEMLKLAGRVLDHINELWDKAFPELVENESN